MHVGFSTVDVRSLAKIFWLNFGQDCNKRIEK